VSDSATIVPQPKDMRFSRRNAPCGIAAPWESQESAQYCLFHPVRGSRPTATYAAAICYVRYTSKPVERLNFDLGAITPTVFSTLCNLLICQHFLLSTTPRAGAILETFVLRFTEYVLLCVVFL
jgi:hypothetical protein